MTDELIQRDICQREWDAKMGELVRLIRVLVTQEGVAGLSHYLNQSNHRDESSEYDMYEDRDSMASVMNGSQHNPNEMSSSRMLSSLVGGTASLLDGAKFSPAPAVNKSNGDDLRVIDISKNKQEVDAEFDQV